MIGKIAFSGMRGRKKDSLIMLIAVVLSVLFVVTSLNLFTSVQAAKEKDKIERFGQWKSAFYHIDEDSLLLLEKEKLDIHLMTLLGFDEKIGLIASLPEKHEGMGNFKMFEGRMPNAPGEIAFEFSQLDNFSETLSIGDTIVVEQIYFISDYTSPSNLDPRIQVYIREDIGKKESFKQQEKRLAQEEYDAYLLSMENPNHPKHQFNTDLFDSKEPTSFENFLELYVQRNADRLYSNNDDRNPYISENSEQIYPIFRHGFNQYNTIHTDFIDDYRLERIQKIIYYRSVDLSRSQMGPYFYDLDITENTLTDRIQELGTPYSDYLVISKSYVITGFFDNYSGIWESGNFSLPTAFVSEGEKDVIIHLLEETELISHSGELIKPDSSFGKHIAFLNHTPQKNYSFSENLVVNTLSYPQNEAKTDITLTYSIIALIFIGTVISIFQINYAQIKRRTKKLVLLKSIGMIKSQLIALLLWETFFILIIAIPIGALLGGLFSYCLVFFIQTFSNFSILFHMNISLVLIGLTGAILSVFLGMFIPMRIAKNVPLTGSMNLPVKRSSQKHHHSSQSVKKINLNFSRLMIASYFYEKKKTFITVVIYGIASIMISSTVIFSFFAFKPYFNDVVIPNRPDYVLSFNIGLNDFAINEVKDALLETDTFEDFELVLVGDQLRFYHHALMDIERYKSRNHHENLIGDLNYLNDLASESDDFLYSESAIKTQIFSYPTASQTLQYLYDLAGVDVKQYPYEDFEISDQQAILLVPYHDSHSQISFDFRDQILYNEPYPFYAGDSILVSSLVEYIEDTEELAHILVKEMEIIGVVQGFPEIGIWPFSVELNEPVLITGRAPYRDLYPSTRYRRTPEKYYLDSFVTRKNWMQYGHSFVTLNLKNNNHYSAGNHSIERVTYVPFKQESSFSKPYLSAFEYVKVNPSYHIKQAAFDKSLRLSVIMITLGLSMAVIMMMVQYNIGLSKLENERDKIGILQALGVTNRSFKIFYALSGTAFAFLTLLTTNILFFFSVFIISIFQSNSFLMNLSILLWRFPWKIYCLSQLLFLLVGTLVYFLPCVKILQMQPIKNITSR